MLGVTTTGSHAGSQVLGEVRHRLVDVFLLQLFPGGLQGDFRLGIWCFSSMAPRN